MPLPRKQKPRRKPFVLTVAQAATVALLPGCFSTVTQNPPYVEEPGCPQEAPTTGEACSDVLTCKYELDIGCGPQPATANCDGTSWSINTDISCNPPIPEPCPAEMPSQGAACLGPLTCSYEFDVGCGPQTATATCQDGSWSIDAGISCNPPIPTDNPADMCQYIATEEECATVETCRWLVPGCGDPALSQAGCFAAQDCVGVTCGDAKTCQEASINPCHNQPCDACSMTVKLCLPPGP
ncbi:hypothetical protein [Polyangium sp. 6x1]|uniref:hypothetical protein n=1 Tax=Polyangium sp. 6x1 TaxID=3042689 RepID=UPI0024832C0B|nr:hypothetical protein [Polyangium sp. 6x1]MDI1446053.1 hypothetical protein [Polyangium sp. 6x1]